MTLSKYQSKRYLTHRLDAETGRRVQRWKRFGVFEADPMELLWEPFILFRTTGAKSFVAQSLDVASLWGRIEGVVNGFAVNNCP